MGVWEVRPLLRSSCAVPQDVESPHVEATHPRRFVHPSAWKGAFSEVRLPMAKANVQTSEQITKRKN